MSESTDRVLIAGGGIAGLATAAALGRRGIASVVLERRDQALDAGLGINLPGNAVMALGALGLGDGLERLGAPIGRREYRNRRGRLVFSVDEDAFWGVEARPRCVLRGELLSLLQTVVPEGTVRLGAEVRDIVETPDRVTVELRDGMQEHGALLVGADGVHSTVRALVGSGQAPQAAVLSRSSWRFVTRNPGIDCWVVWSGGTDTVLFIPLGSGRIYGWVAVANDGDSFDEVTAAFEDFPPRVRDVLAAAAAETVPPFLSPLEEVRPTAWTRGRVVLVGDAAHATAPVWAQGAALAVEDALVLGEILVGAAGMERCGARVRAASAHAGRACADHDRPALSRRAAATLATRPHPQEDGTAQLPSHIRTVAQPQLEVVLRSHADEPSIPASAMTSRTDSANRDVQSDQDCCSRRLRLTAAMSSRCSRSRPTNPMRETGVHSVARGRSATGPRQWSRAARREPAMTVASDAPGLPPVAPMSLPARIRALREFHTGPAVVRELAGPVVRVPVGPRSIVAPYVLVTSPQGAHDVLAGSSNDTMDKLTQVHLETRLIGDNVFNLPYEPWKPQRRTLQPLFTKQHVATFAGHMAGGGR